MTSDQPITFHEISTDAPAQTTEARVEPIPDTVVYDTLLDCIVERDVQLAEARRTNARLQEFNDLFAAEIDRYRIVTEELKIEVAELKEQQEWMETEAARLQRLIMRSESA